MLGGRERPKSEKKPVKLEFQPCLFNYFLFQSFFFKLESQRAVKMTFAFEAISVEKRLTFKGEKVGLGDYTSNAHKHFLLACKYMHMDTISGIIHNLW